MEIKNKVTILVVFCVMALSSGCQAEQPSAGGVQSEANKKLKGDFGTKLKNAEMFWQYKELGDKFYQNGDYENALAEYLKASEIAGGRAPQAIGHESLAKTYEALGKLNMAIKHYGLASDASMNNDKKSHYQKQIDRLKDVVS
jgi:tetratricopeptide (TPR) repeat protein